MGKYYDNSIIPQEMRRDFDVYDRIEKLGIPIYDMVTAGTFEGGDFNVIEEGCVHVPVPEQHHRAHLGNERRPRTLRLQRTEGRLRLAEEGLVEPQDGERSRVPTPDRQCAPPQVDRQASENTSPASRMACTMRGTPR